MILVVPFMPVGFNTATDDVFSTGTEADKITRANNTPITTGYAAAHTVPPMMRMAMQRQLMLQSLLAEPFTTVT